MHSQSLNSDECAYYLVSRFWYCTYPRRSVPLLLLHIPLNWLAWLAPPPHKSSKLCVDQEGPKPEISALRVPVLVDNVWG